MSHWTLAFETSALTLAVLWLGLGALKRSRDGLQWIWLAFCASMALFLVRRIGGADLGAWQFLIGVGACFTCNAFWLVARGLFRPGQAIGRAPVLCALGIAGLLMAQQVLQLGAAWNGWSSETTQRINAALGEFSGLLCSTVLVLAFWEGMRGWTSSPAIERRLRVLYLGTYGGCVLLSGSLPKLFGPAQLAEVEALLEASAAFGILLVVQALVWWRLKHPLPLPEIVSVDDPQPAADRQRQSGTDALPESARAPVRSDEHALAARLDALVRSSQLYLEPELKLKHLAQALDVSEYRISRAITGALGERNINRWLNQWRIRHAQQLLRDPGAARQSILDIALASGFASLGPFNRAFKEQIGMTPGLYRNRGGGVATGLALDA